MSCVNPLFRLPLGCRKSREPPPPERQFNGKLEVIYCVGGVASPALANLTLDGLEPAIRAAIQPRRDKVNFIRYADDFVITGSSPELLEAEVRPLVEAFLHTRGLELSPEKTLITHAGTGHARFLGYDISVFRDPDVRKGCGHVALRLPPQVLEE